MDFKKLTKLFDLLCDDFSKMLESGEMTAADRKLLIEFFRDNEISCVGANNKSVQSIVENLPFDENVENQRSINH